MTLRNSWNSPVTLNLNMYSNGKINQFFMIYTVLVVLKCHCTIYSYFMPVWGIVKTAAPRGHGQLDALLPKAERPRAMVYRAVHGTVFVYSAKQP